MILQNRNVRIPLRAKNGVWKFQLNGVKWNIPICMELLYAYHLIGVQDYSRVAWILRANYKHITSIEIDAFIQHFEKAHPVEDYPFNINEIPIYATEKHPLIVPTVQSYLVLLTPAQEREILDLIINNTKVDGQFPIDYWFRKYVDRYGLAPRYQNQMDTHYIDLAVSFCELHGIDYASLYDPWRQPFKNSFSDPMVWLSIALFVALIIYAALRGLLMLLTSNYG